MSRAEGAESSGDKVMLLASCGGSAAWCAERPSFGEWQKGLEERRVFWNLLGGGGKSSPPQKAAGAAALQLLGVALLPVLEAEEGAGVATDRLCPAPDLGTELP